MLLKELDYINREIAKSFNSRFNAQFSYETGTTSEMNLYLINKQPPLPLIWWIRDDVQTIKSTVKVPMSSMTISTISAGYMIWVKSDIDDSLKDKNNNHYTLDELGATFITAMQDVKPSRGTLTVSAADSTTNINQTANGLVGVGISMSIVSPDNIDYCVDC
tara:strand:- start:329 stop:814 length:486 start_codon:yes stop_codon:yes gene_type:complete